MATKAEIQSAADAGRALAREIDVDVNAVYRKMRDKSGGLISPQLALRTLCEASITAWARERSSLPELVETLDEVHDQVLKRLVARVIEMRATPDGPEITPGEVAATLAMVHAYHRLNAVLGPADPRSAFVKSLHALIGAMAQIAPEAPPHAPCDAMYLVMERLHDLAKKASPAP